MREDGSTVVERKALPPDTFAERPKLSSVYKDGVERLEVKLPPATARESATLQCTRRPVIGVVY
jgi:hypothetical protein